MINTEWQLLWASAAKWCTDVQQGNQKRTMAPPEPPFFKTSQQLQHNRFDPWSQPISWKAHNTLPAEQTEKKLFSVQSMNEDRRNKEIKRTNIESSLNAQSAHVYWPLSSGAVECQQTLDKVYFCDNFLLIMWNTCTSALTHSQRQPLGSSCGRC